ncbi:MAG: hypothetical protein RJA33_34 [Actinomycetota bacterium]
MKFAYFINLDQRPDRLEAITLNSHILAIPLTRVSAVDAETIDKTKCTVPAAVAACWESHQKVARIFLESDEEHYLVFEDDVDLNSRTIESINKLCVSELDSIDLLQLGFCIHSNRLSNRVRYALQKNLVKSFGFFRILDTYLVKALLQRLYGNQFKFIPELDQYVALATFELGSHAYIASRRFAEFILKFNTPVMIPADLALMEMSRVPEFQSFRLVVNLVEQSDSQSSISNAANNVLENKLNRQGR